ncbi:MAG: FecR domain-containing protein [Cyclonatronaceae bacterium]
MTNEYRYRNPRNKRKDDAPETEGTSSGAQGRKPDGAQDRAQNTGPISEHAREPLPGGFDGPESRDLETLWQTSAETPPRHEPPGANETEKALEKVHQRLGFTEVDDRTASDIQPDSPARSAAKSGRVYRAFAWVAAAAVVLLAFGLGYLLYPKSVTAPHGEQAMVSLPDGSMIELNSGTTIRFNRLFGIRNREVRLDGEAFFTVVPAEKPFIVTANRAVVEVTGTSFNVRSRSDDPGYETRVQVASGSVALYPSGRADRSVTLHAGDWSRWNITMETAVAPEPATPEHIGEWRRNRFHFRNETLGMIFREIERRFDIRIQLEIDRMASEVLTAHYTDPDNAERIIEDICHVKGLRYARTANGFRIYR